MVWAAESGAAPRSARRSLDAPVRPSPHGQGSGPGLGLDEPHEDDEGHGEVPRDRGQVRPGDTQPDAVRQVAATHTTVPANAPANTHCSRASVSGSRTKLRTRATMSPSCRTTEQPLLAAHTVGSGSPVEARTNGKALSSAHPPLDPSREYRSWRSWWDHSPRAASEGHDDAGEAGDRDANLDVGGQQAFRGHPLNHLLLPNLLLACTGCPGRDFTRSRDGSGLVLRLLPIPSTR